MSEWFDAGALEQIEQPGSRGFTLEGVDGVAFFVVRKQGSVHAYRNRCPHTGAPLEWLPDEFLDLDKSLIECAMHGALFRPDTGQCLRGPCAGQYLERLASEVRDGRLLVDVSALRDSSS